MYHGDTVSENATESENTIRVIQDFVFMCLKTCSIYM